MEAEAEVEAAVVPFRLPARLASFRRVVRKMPSSSSELAFLSSSPAPQLSSLSLSWEIQKNCTCVFFS